VRVYESEQEARDALDACEMDITGERRSGNRYRGCADGEADQNAAPESVCAGAGIAEDVSFP
jgi:hypothetical protein